MKKYGIFYGSTTGATEDVARRLAKVMNIEDADVHNVANTAPDAVADYETLILGSSTWGSGDLQDDWYDFLTGLKALTLKGKKVAIFGVGDENMSDTFCNAVAKIYDGLQDTGADFIGVFNTDGYHFERSEAARGGEALGLLLDETNHPELTDGRIAEWAEQISK